jgi:hypothetical protein
MTDINPAMFVRPLDWKQQYYPGGEISPVWAAKCPWLDTTFYAEEARHIPKVNARYTARVLALLNLEAVQGLVEAATCASIALKPFADCVFNDNGDCTVTDTYKVKADAFIAADFALAYARAALAKLTGVGE